MKLRILDNSIRLRLDRSELRQLLLDGRVERRTVFGVSASFTFALYAIEQDAPLRATLGPCRIDVYVDARRATAWARSDTASLTASQPAGEADLHLLVEKDFPCRHTDAGSADEKFTPETMSIGLDERRRGAAVKPDCGLSDRAAMDTVGL